MEATATDEAKITKGSTWAHHMISVVRPTLSKTWYFSKTNPGAILCAIAQRGRQSIGYRMDQVSVERAREIYRMAMNDARPGQVGMEIDSGWTPSPFGG